MRDTKQVLFTIGDEEYGLDITLVSGIENYMNVVGIPNAPNCIKGIINLRGDVIPVYSLRRKFGFKEAKVTEKTKLIITKSKGILLAYEVDEVKEIINIQEKQISDAPSIVRNDATAYIGAVANLEGRIVILLSHDGVITDAEKESIENMVIE